MARLPEIQPRGAVTRGPQSSLSGAEIANPFQQIANGLDAWSETLERKDVADAQDTGANAVYRDPDGTLKVDSRSNLSASGRAYNAAAQQGYTARLAGDIRTKGIELTNAAKGNIDSFNSGWKSFRDQTLTAVPKEFRGAVTTMLDSEGPRFSLGVSEQKRTSDLKEFEGNIKSQIQLLDDDASALARGGGVGTTAYKEKQAQIQTLYQSLADNPDFNVGQDEAAIALKRMEGRHMSDAMLGQVDTALNSPGGLAKARELANAITTDTGVALSPQERRQYAGLANERINGYVAQVKANLKPTQDQSTVIQKRLKEGVGLDNDDIDTTARTLAAGGDLSGAMELYQARAVAKTLQGFRLADNPTQVNRAESMFASAAGSDSIIAAMQGVESSNDPSQISPKGAAGVMQVMPETADGIAVELGDANYPANGSREDKQAYLKEHSAEYGTHYFNKMMVRYNGDTEAALIAYNGGPERADNWLSSGRDDSKIPKESADYYKKVLARTNQVASYTPEQASAAKSFLQTRTDKGAPAIDGLQDTFAVKLSRMLQSAPPEIRESLGVFSGARSNERQAELWQAALKKYGSIDEARRWVAPPGKSEHNHGNAADLSYNGQSLANAPADVVKWLHDNAGQYGLKFPLGNENWHIEDDSTRGGTGTRPPVDPEVVKEYRQEVTSDARDLFTGIKAGFDKGLTPAVSDINLLSRQLAIVDDQDFRKQVSDYFSSQSAIQSIGNAAPAQVESLIASLQADAGDGATLAQQQILTGLQEAQKAQAQALKDDPIGYAARKGMVAAPPALDLGNPDSWGPTFQGLQNSVDVLASRGMVGDISALRPEMQAQISRALTNSTPQDSVKLLGSMAQNMSPNTYKATLGGLYASGQARSVAAAGALVPDNPEAAEGVLRGQQLLKENPLLAPKKTEDNSASIDDLLPPTAFAPALEGARQTLLDAATARYADLSNQVGDTSGELNDDRMQQAIKEVTGGLVDMNGYQVVAPKYGQSQDDFDKSLSALQDGDLTGAVTSSGTAVKAADLRDQGRLRAIADGRYILEFGDPASPQYAMRQPSPGSYGQPSVFVLDMRGR
ncbi:transglycosylase SLT domain-containing protein [Rhizobium laguerreae]|uniref:transglycosylase SLT domain-containing protein n=1 Tax=Rhizobium laguerreae TaxID=1076926 RepID=UPI001FE38AB5|nr:transglycosylase SLT domain-containing protein [Rhizobium laguerreae]